MQETLSSNSKRTESRPSAVLAADAKHLRRRYDAEAGANGGLCFGLSTARKSHPDPLA